MKNLLIALCAVLPLGLFAQYTPQDTLSGVEVSYKWAAEKWYKPKSGRVLLIKSVNRNEHAVSYSFEISISRDGKTLETSPSEEFCLKAKTTGKGRLNGIVVRPVSLSASDIEKKNFDLEIEMSDVEKIDECIRKK